MRFSGYGKFIYSIHIFYPFGLKYREKKSYLCSILHVSIEERRHGSKYDNLASLWFIGVVRSGDRNSKLRVTSAGSAYGKNSDGKFKLGKGGRLDFDVDPRLGRDKIISGVSESLDESLP